MKSLVCIDVALPRPVEGVYTYCVPRKWEKRVGLGCRVLVPVRKKYTTGFVVKAWRGKNGNSLREIVDIIDETPLFDTVQLRLTKWIAEYYLCSWGEVLKAAGPAGLHLESKVTIRPKEPYSRKLLECADRIVPKGSRILEAVYKKGEIRLRGLQRRVGEEGLNVAVKELEKKGYIELHTALDRLRVTTQYEEWVAVRRPFPLSEDQMRRLEKRAPRQSACLHLLFDADGGTMSVSELRRRWGIGRAVLRRMETANLIVFGEKEVVRDPSREFPAETLRHFVLTEEQKKVLLQIERSIRDPSFQVFLLHGVTGSGKTEVYIRAIKEVIKRGRQAIVLVPEISLTPQTVARFKTHFENRVAVLHSRLSPGERYDMWRHIHQGDFDIVVGARSAVFAPVRRLGLIIVDEEHETTYKQTESAPRYHARDVAIMRARFSRAVTLLGTATPSIESFFNASTGKYGKGTLSFRIDHRPLPSVTLVNMCQERETGNPGIFSRALSKKIEERMTRNEQILLLQNRRGFSNYVQCEQCGYVATCRNCSVSLTYHSVQQKLRCHYCGVFCDAPSVCPECHGHRLRYRGAGTQRIEQEIRTLFPAIRVLRMDLDTTRKKGAHSRILKAFERGEADVLLGTQMIAKGLDLQRVTLVGVIDADVGLHLPDFRASERTFDLLTQVAGRAGRSELGGEVLIQTFSPDNPAVDLARSHNFEAFYDNELVQRRELRYPPFSRLVSLRVQGRTQRDVIQTAEMLAERIASYMKQKPEVFIQMLGPAPAPVTRIKGNYRWQILVKGENQRILRECVTMGIKAATVGRNLEGLRIIVDVDPVDML
ncbi:MAG: primosomal protein N' [Gemmatimonadota bacterium]|nr:MAG: primosomal protein N' [Gemmatimonadota bacterium]